MHPSSPSPEPRRPRLFRAALTAVIASTILVLAACTQQQPVIGLQVDAASVELVRGADATHVLVTLTRSGGATGDVELTLSGLPSDVTASFSPAVLSGNVLTSTLSLGAPAEAVDGYHALDVMATSGGLEAATSLTVQVKGLSVTGTLAGFFTGPLSGVSIASQGETAVTDSGGRFTLHGLSVPYDITAWSTVDKWAHIYQGLSDSEVTLGTSSATAPPPVVRGTTITGSLAGVDIPVEANQVVMVCVEGLIALVPFCDQLITGESAFALNVQWTGGTTRSARLHVLQIESDASGLPVAYPGYATFEVDLTDGVPVVFVEPIDLGESLETTTVGVEIDTPAAISNTIGAVQVGPGLEIMVMNSTSGAVGYDVLMPVIPGADYTFASIAGGLQLGWTAGVTGTEAKVVVPGIPTIDSPAYGATGVTAETEFSSTNPTGGPVTWLWSAAGYHVSLTTMADAVNLPDTSEYGLPLPSAVTIDLELLASGGSTAESGARAFIDFNNLYMFMVMGASVGFDEPGSLSLADALIFDTAP